MKIAVVGNSHIAALKQALRMNAELPASLGFTFWGVPGKYFRAIECTSEYLISERVDILREVSDGANDQLFFEAFDVIWLYAGDLDLAELIEAFSDGEQIIGNYSSALIKQGVSAYLEELHIVRLAKQLRHYFDGTIFLSPKPLPAQGDEAKNRQHGMTQLEESIADHLSKLNLLFLQQPDITRSGNRFTHLRYTIGSVRLPGDLKLPHNKDDRRHMNSEYGRIMLSEFVCRLMGGQY